VISKLYEDAIPRPGVSARGVDRTMVALSFAVGAVYLLTGGSIFLAVSVIGIAGVILLTLYRIDWGFMFFIGVVLAFDQFPPSGFDRSIIGKEYFQNLKSQPLLASVDFAVANPLELHLFLLFVTWVFMILMKKPMTFLKVPGKGPIIVFFSWLTLSAVMGVSNGGDFLPALWEIRALFYLAILYFFVPQIIQSKEQIHQMFWVVIAALGFKTLQGTIRVLNLGFNFGNRTQLTSHEDPLFFISVFMLMAGLYMYREKGGQRAVMTWLLLPMIAVFFLAQRRATWGALAACIVVYFILIDNAARRKFLLAILPFVLIAGSYLGAFWDSPPTGIGYGAHLLRSAFSSEKEEAGDRYYSNLYRDFENYNLAQTSTRAPIAGIGFGQKYDQPVKLVKIPFPLAEYIPHNEILWLYVKMGAIGFFLFWFFIFSWVSRATALFMRISDPYLKAVSVLMIVGVLGQVICSFYDLQLTYARNMVFLGTLMGLYPALERYTQADKPVPAPPRPAPGHLNGV
jgi:hypothetical protein